jgi:hypothetical protein
MTGRDTGTVLHRGREHNYGAKFYSTAAIT